MFLMTNGTALSNQFDNNGFYCTKKWWKLTPDNFGSFINGTWSPIADSLNTRTFFSSAVLKDGRFLVIGGEYSDAGGDSNKVEIYDPVSNTWTAITPPFRMDQRWRWRLFFIARWKILLGYYNGTKTAIYDPVTKI